MTDQRLTQIEAIILEALELPEAEQNAFISKRAQGDPELEKDVHKYLEALKRTNSFMNKPIPPNFISKLNPEAIPDTIGPYRIIRPIGEGGMGVVYLAQGDKPRRQVALKVLKAGWTDKDLRSRFIGEYGALARMQHSAIARYYEAGVTEDNRPWFALEYCPGEPIITYCKNHNLTLDEKLHLFQLVLNGITHAHSKAVIHRDIKPSNILGFKEDDKHVVRIIDFGIARLLGEGQLGDESIFTSEYRVIGTPSYMAPEITTDATNADTRSDVWSLGIILYIMLTDQLPFGKPNALLHEIFREICFKEPPLPSHFSSLSLNRITRLFGDLDAITLKALEKKPDKRYQSAAAFAEDINAFLENRPVTARRQTFVYRASKYIRRNRLAVTIAALFVATVAVAFFFNLRLRQEAQAQAARKEKVITFLSDTYGAVNPFGGKKEMTVIQAIDQATPWINDRFDDDPETRADIHQALAETYLGRGALDRATYHAGELKRAAPTEDQIIEADLITVLILLEKEEHQNAETLCDAILEKAPEYSPEWLKAQLYRAHAIREQARYEEAANLYNSILPALNQNFGESHQHTLNGMRGLATTIMEQGHYEKALTLYQQILPIEQTDFGHNHPRTLETRNYLARIYMFLGDHENSLTSLRSILSAREEILGEGNPNTLKTRINMLHTLYRAAQYEEAKIFGEETVRLHSQHVGPEAQETLKAKNNLALVYEALGETERAAALYQATYTTQARVFGPQNKLTLSYGHNLGSFYITLGRYNEAEALLKKTWHARKAVYGPTHIRSLFTCFTLGECYVARGQLNASLPYLEEAHAGILTIHEPTHEFSVILAGFLGYVQCQLEEDYNLLRFALEHLDKVEPKYKNKIEAFAAECKKAR